MSNTNKKVSDKPLRFTEISFHICLSCAEEYKEKKEFNPASAHALFDFLNDQKLFDFPKEEINLAWEKAKTTYWNKVKKFPEMTQTPVNQNRTAINLFKFELLTMYIKNKDIQEIINILLQK